MPKRKVLSGSRKRVNEVEYHKMLKKEKKRAERADARKGLAKKTPKKSKNLTVKRKR